MKGGRSPSTMQLDSGKCFLVEVNDKDGGKSISERQNKTSKTF